MGIDLATWRARIGLNYYHKCLPLQTRWRSSGGWLYQPGVSSWGVGEVMNDTSLVLKVWMTVVVLSLLLQYIVRNWPILRRRGRGGKVHHHWWGNVSGTLNGGETLLLRAIVVVIPLLLVIAGDVETNPGPEEPNLRVLLNELHPVRDSWYKVGLQLDIPYTELNCFRKMYSDPSDSMCEVLMHWLKTAVDPPATWQAVVNALKSPIVNEVNVAAQLESKYCTQVQHTREHSPVEKSEGCHYETCSTNSESPIVSSAIQSNSASPLLNERSQKPPFGCGCGKCTCFSFLDRGCPTPIPSASSFPYLDLTGLTHEQQQELTTRLQLESEKIMIQFQELVSATIRSLIRRNVLQEKLLTHVMTLGAFGPVFKEPQVPVFCHRFKELKAANTVYEIFLVLNDYFSFFNYQLIEHIIKSLGTRKDKARLQKYKKDFINYAKRRMFECPSEFGPLSDNDDVDVFVKVDSHYENCTVAQIERFRYRLSEFFCVSSQGLLRLCRVDKGCLQLMFQIPSFVQQEIFPLSREEERALAAEGVIKLTCGEYQFLVKLSVFLICRFSFSF